MSSRAGPTARSDPATVTDSRSWSSAAAALAGGGDRGGRAGGTRRWRRLKDLCGTAPATIGSIAVSGTPEQRALGVIDSPEEHAEDYPGLRRRTARSPSSSGR